MSLSLSLSHHRNHRRDTPSSTNSIINIVYQLKLLNDWILLPDSSKLVPKYAFVIFLIFGSSGACLCCAMHLQRTMAPFLHNNNYNHVLTNHRINHPVKYFPNALDNSQEQQLMQLSHTPEVTPRNRPLFPERRPALTWWTFGAVIDDQFVTRVIVQEASIHR